LLVLCFVVFFSTIVVNKDEYKKSNNSFRHNRWLKKLFTFMFI